MNGGPEISRASRRPVRQHLLLLVFLFSLLVLHSAEPVETACAKKIDDAFLAFEAKKYPEAVQLFSEVLKEAPESVKANFGMAYALYFQDEEALSLRYLDRVLELDPRCGAALGLRADLLYHYKHDTDGALADLEKLSSLEELAARHLRLRAFARCKKKNFAGAFEDIEKLKEKGGATGDWLGMRAFVLRIAGSYKEAAEDCTTLLQKDEKNPEWYRRRAYSHESMGSYQEAVADYEKVLELERDEQSIRDDKNELAWTLATCPDTRVHDGRRAVELATSACELGGWKNPNHIDTLAAAHARAGDFENAARTQARAMEVEGMTPRRSEFAERLALYESGKAYVVVKAPDAAREWSVCRSESFDTVWNTVNENYFDPTFGGMDWRAIRERYRLRLWSVPDKRELGRLLQEMLNELKRTHFAIIPREMAVLAPEERGRIGYSGATAAVVEGRVTVVRVKAGSPAAQAGIVPGDVLCAINDTTLETIEAAMSQSVASPRKRTMYLCSFANSWLSAPVGREIKVRLESADGRMRDVVLKTASFEGEWSEAAGSTPSEPMDYETARTEDGVVYLRFNAFALPTMKVFKRVIREMRPGDRLLLDLRGNGGGITLMAAGMTGRLVGSRQSLGVMRRRYTTEDFFAYPQRQAFLGPVAVLVNSASASTSEILAAGLKELGRARVFGETTAGAALPSLFRKLPTGDLLQYAIADIKTPNGLLIEGNGVTPDVEVLMLRADCAAGRDTVREAAEQWLLSQPSRDLAALGMKEAVQ